MYVPLPEIKIMLMRKKSEQELLYFDLVGGGMGRRGRGLCSSQNMLKHHHRLLAPPHTQNTPEFKKAFANGSIYFLYKKDMLVTRHSAVCWLLSILAGNWCISSFFLIKIMVTMNDCHWLMLSCLLETNK